MKAFIGPGDHAMNELGDKINSTILAQSVNVSVVPWSGTGVFVDYEVRFISFTFIILPRIIKSFLKKKI